MARQTSRVLVGRGAGRPVLVGTVLVCAVLIGAVLIGTVLVCYVLTGATVSPSQRAMETIFASVRGWPIT